MGTVNKVILVGNLGRDPEYTAKGGWTLSVAAKDYRQDKTEWHQVVLRSLPWDDRTRLRKGCLVYVSGYLQTRSWLDDYSKRKRYVTEVIAQEFALLDSPEVKQDTPEPYMAPDNRWDAFRESVCHDVEELYDLPI